MNPHKRTVEYFLKLAGRKAAYLPLAVLSVALGAFVVGAIVNAASLPPPTAAYPEGQPQLDLGGGGGASNLLDALNGGSLAEWPGFKNDTVIGGRLGLGQTRKTIGAGTMMIGYPLDMQIVHKESEDPTPTNPPNLYLNKNDAAVLRIASGSTKENEKLYTGVRLDRIGLAPSTNFNDTFSEKWFIGMDNATDNLVIRANSSENLVSIDPSKGAACFGGMFKDLSRGSGNVVAKYKGSVGGYKGANTKCQNNTHVCTVEEMLQTVNCQSDLPAYSSTFSDPANAQQQIYAWISKGSSGYTLSASNDCKGWNSDRDTIQGAVWAFNSKGGYSGLSKCNVDFPFACCK